MKLQKVISKIFPSMRKTASTAQKKTEPAPYYNSKNATIEEFRAYVQYLAKNNINRTFYEPERLVTAEERKVQQQKEAELKPFREFVHNLAKNNINRTFYC